MTYRKSLYEEDRLTKPRSRLWWYRRMRRAYKKHGVLPYSRRRTWWEAGFAQRQMPIKEQWRLEPIHD